MHDVGDGLVRAGMRDPVLDTDYLSVSYKDLSSLYRDLYRTGSRNSLAGRRKSLTGKGRLERMEKALMRGSREGLIEIRLEIVYGHAWGGGPRQAPGEYRIGAEEITRR